MFKNQASLENILKTWWFEMVIQMLKMKNMHIFYKKNFLSYQYHLESSDICSICQKNLSGLKIISWKVDIWSFRKLFFFCKSETVKQKAHADLILTLLSFSIFIYFSLMLLTVKVGFRHTFVQPFLSRNAFHVISAQGVNLKKLIMNEEKPPNKIRISKKDQSFIPLLFEAYFIPICHFKVIRKPSI